MGAVPYKLVPLTIDLLYVLCFHHPFVYEMLQVVKHFNMTSIVKHFRIIPNRILIYCNFQPHIPFSHHRNIPCLDEDRVVQRV